MPHGLLNQHGHVPKPPGSKHHQNQKHPPSPPATMRRDKLDKTYDKLKFKRQEEAALAADAAAAAGRAAAIAAERAALEAAVAETAARKVGQ
jgi:hypothetical protein